MTTALPSSGIPGRLPIGEAALRLSLHPRTLMAWERMGLVRPARDGGRRVYSEDEIRWLGCLQAFNRSGGVSLQGISAMLRFVPCWGIRAELAAARQVPGAPAEWPAADCLDRVEQAYAGEAPAECRDCGIWRNRRAQGHGAWREKMTGTSVACATGEDE